ncbi:MAG: ADP-ribosylglycohydrolase family protein [Pseudomonadota bacterium]|nr:ADP-ribosylglycohydrolase family protein [Pseudomonadota bacterium]
MALPSDYADRVYAGVLGKVIGVYLGRPFEGWPYVMIQKRLGDVEYYVHDKLDVPLIVTDDDISGTFTFIRALEDHGNNPNISAKEVGESWLNYLIRERTILWWGGLGNSTEHTAYLRLANGVDAPASGSIEMNGKVVAEQIGAQIFIDGWAMVSPGDPDQAVKFTDAAARVSHDGEAVYGAKVLTAMEAMAFVESDINKLIDKAVTYIPGDSVIATMIDDLRNWHAKEQDWRATRELLQENYGYDKYGGNCHMVPNHGLIIHSLLHGEGDFSETMKIVNTSGWDTDCNSGNVGCLMGILGGIDGIDAGLNKGLDWRGPVADRLYVPTADGDRGISDCVREASHIINMGHTLAKAEPYAPKNGAQFHFSFPGSVQGFQTQAGDAEISNVAIENARALHVVGKAGSRVGTPVFTPSKETAKYFEKRGYALMASPRIFPGQIVTAAISGDVSDVNLYLAYYGEDDEPAICQVSTSAISDDSATLQVEVPQLPGPVFEVGLELISDATVNLHSVSWSGTPQVTFEKPAHKGSMWQRAWINGVDSMWAWGENYRLIHNQGMGMISQGTREWRDYTVSADVTPHLAHRAGIAARVQGLTRYYAILLAQTSGGKKVQLVRCNHYETVIAEADFDWQYGETYLMDLQVDGSSLTGDINGQTVISGTDDALDSGAIALLIEEGRTATQQVKVSPI